MNKTARLFVLVQDHECEVIDVAGVEGSTSSEGPFSRIPYDKILQRHLVDNLEPGPYEIHVTGPKDTIKEHRRVMLKSGDNHINVMLAKPGMLGFEAGGMNYYFFPRKDLLLLSVKGIKDDKEIFDLLNAAHLKYEELTDSSGNKTKGHMLLTVNIGEKEQAEENQAKLEEMLDKEFPQRGLSARLALPIFKRGKPAFGLTNEIIVRFKSWVTLDQIRKIVADYDLVLERNIVYLGNSFLLKRHKSLDYDILDLLKDIQKEEGVIYAEPNILMRLEKSQYTPNDYLFPEVPHLNLIKCDEAWQTLESQPGGNAGGSPEITIAVLDPEGVDPTHPELTGSLSDGSEKMVANFNFSNMTDQVFDDLERDHGTQCAGSATARMDNNIGASGVAPNCHLIGGCAGSSASTLEISDMWIWMAGFSTGSTDPNFPEQLQRGADIISNSWLPSWTPDVQVVRDTLDFLTTYGRGGRGCIICFAAGNDGHVPIDGLYPYLNDAKTITIGSSINSNPTNPCSSRHVDHNGQSQNLPAVVDTRSYFSPYGLTMDIVSPSNTSYVISGIDAIMIDPILAPVKEDTGDWPGNASAQTTLTQDVNQNDTVIPVADSTGFQAGEYALFGNPGATPNETKRITSVNPGQLIISSFPSPLENAYPAGTTVTTGDNDYAKNPWRGFGGTSHSCATVAGAAALLLSVVPDLTWIEVRSLLLDNAVPIDSGQTNIIGQWIDLDGDGDNEFSQWYGYGRLDVNASVNAAVNLSQRADIVIRDNLDDTGIVPSQGWHAHSPDIWVGWRDEPIPELDYTDAPPHEPPRYGVDNYVYLRVKNCGDAPAPVVYVRALITHFPGIEFQYPDDWQPTPRIGEQPELPLKPGTYLIGEDMITDLEPGADIIIKMTWESSLVPPEVVNINGNDVRWHPCILAEVSPHDGPAPVDNAYPVKGNNNLAHRNISIDYPAGGGWGFFMSAVIAGSRHEKGVDAILIDRSDVASKCTVILRALDKELMQRWIDTLLSGKGFESIGTLDNEFLSEDRIGAMNFINPLKYVGKIMAFLGNLVCKFIQWCCKKKHLRLLECIWIGEYKGQQVIRIGPYISAISLPMRLSSRQYTALLIGMERAGEHSTIGGTIRVSQMRSDGEISPGYEIRG